MELTLKALAEMTGGELEGDPGLVLRGAAGLGEAGPADVSFLGNPKYASQAAGTKAGCVLLPRSSKGHGPSGGARVYVDDPVWAFAQVLRLLEAEAAKGAAPIVDERAVIHYEAHLAQGVSVGPLAVIERRAVVGEGSRVGAQCTIGPGVRIGRGCLIHPQVTVQAGCVLGDRVIIHPGTVIGGDGYGFSTDRATGQHRKIPQIGNVVVEDDVEIGSNVCVDRATVGSTRIGAGTKIDNLVQIGHNVQIGRNCLIVSQVGISGSTKIGHQVVLAGQAGIIGHLTIGDGAVITAQSGIIGDVEPKAILFGSPARPHREAMKLQALWGRLPEMYEQLKALAARVESFLGPSEGEAGPAGARDRGGDARRKHVPDAP